MGESTLTALQNLKDAAFHALCDEIIPRLHHHCFPITPHGRNDRGNSIRGQPDSYVGDTAASCRIAIQYSVQTASWWVKAVEEITEARKACPSATEIVIALPRDIDREKPTAIPGTNWLHDAKDSAAPAKLTIVAGRQICQELDTASQDLRRIYLGIPCSRATSEALATSCKESSDEVVLRLESLDRYNRVRYVERDADESLFQLWQECLRRSTLQTLSGEKRLFIPLVADSGLGKTSLLAHFTQRSSRHAPVLMLLARDLSLDSDDSLLRVVMDRLQGSIDSEARLSEEASVAAKFRGTTPLTVVLDGLDETANADSLRRALNGWLSSRLGSSSVLITSSRIEFWRRCRDAAWRAFILSDLEPRRVVKPLRVEEQITSLDPMQGLELPGLFTTGELGTAWEKAGRSTDELWSLTSAVREQLRHPFAAASALELLADGTQPQTLTTRAAILGMWLQRRLEHDSDERARITPDLLREALLVVASKAYDADGSWVAVDDLSKAPRFNPHRPPGVVVERLLASGLLETRPSRSDQIRFAKETIQDYFAATLAIEGIRTNPEDAAAAFKGQPFSRSVATLEPIGLQISGQPYAAAFVTKLAAIDASMAAVAMRPGLDTYSTVCRRCVVEQVGQLQCSRFAAEQALAVELLGRMPCIEAEQELSNYWCRNKPSARLRPILAHAAISLGIVGLAEDVFRTWWFKHDNYFVDLGPELAASPEEFRNALSRLARIYLNQSEHSEDYQRAVMLLGYLQDPEVIDAIDRRTLASHPYFYESLCLLRIGTAEALHVYKRLINAYLTAKGEADVVNEEYDRWSAVFPFPQHIGRRPSQELEEFAIELIRSPEKDNQSAGCSIAGIVYTARPFLEMVQLGLFNGHRYSNYGGVGRVIGADLWLDTWNTAQSLATKRSLIVIAADLRDSRIEDVLIVSLRTDELRNSAANALLVMGSKRGCPAMRAMLSDAHQLNEDQRWTMCSVVQALISLRDEESVAPIVQYMKTGKADENARWTAATGLASFGTTAAETAVRTMEWARDEERALALVQFGTRECVEAAVEIAKRPEHGVKWLLEAVKLSFFVGGRSGDRYRSDVDIEPILEFVATVQPDAELYDLLESLLDDLDGTLVRDQFADWWDLRDTPQDVELKNEWKLSEVAKRELARRGDLRVLRPYLDGRVEDCTRYNMSDHLVDELGVFPKSEVLLALRHMLAEEIAEKRTIAILDILGRVGERADALTMKSIADSSSDAKVANTAFEAYLRLTDPLRLAQDW